jgi:hypothetical protein
VSPVWCRDRGLSGRRPRLARVSEPDDQPAVPPAGALQRAPDDSDVGWGERLTDPDDDDRRYLEDRPPHWGSD